MTPTNHRVVCALSTVHYVFAGVLLVRLVVLTRLTASALLLPLRGDMHFYDDWAQRILHGHLTDHLAFYGLPLYAYLLALIYKLVGYGPFVPGLLQAAFDAGTAAIIYKLAVRVFARGQLVGLLAAAGWAFFAPAQTYAVILMPTAWFVFVFWLVLWRIVRSDSSLGRGECLLLGLLIGVAAMGVAMILFLIPLVLAALFLKRRIDDRRMPLRAPSQHQMVRFAVGAALLISGIIAGSSPCWIHNYFIAREPVLLSAHGGVNFWIGNNPLANGYPRFPPGLHAGQELMLKDSVNVAEKSAGRPLQRSEVSAFWSTKARDYIRGNSGEWLWLLGRKAKNFWNAFQYDDLSMITALREQHITFPALRFGLVAALAIPGLLMACRRFPLSRWIATAVVLQMIALLPVFITERYRLAAVPGLLLFAAFGLSIFWEACATNRLRRAAVYMAVLIASTIFVAWPVRDPALWALDIYNSGWQAFESGNLPLAEQKLQLAYAYVPENAETNFALGNLRLAQGKTNDAKSYYFATLRLDPTHEGGYNNLGVLALQEKRWSLAARFFEDALKQDSRDAKTHYLLAEAQFRSGDLRHAKDEITEALKLSPKQPEFAELRRQIEQQSE